MADGMLPDICSDEKSHVRPIGIDVFDVDRQRFLVAFREFMFDAAVPRTLRQTEYLATTSAMSQIAVLAEVDA